MITIIMSVLIANDKTFACTAHLVIFRISERVGYVPNYADMRSTIANTNENTASKRGTKSTAVTH